MAKSKTKSKSSSESSVQPDANHIAIQGKLYNPYKIVTQHINELSELIESTSPTGESTMATKEMRKALKKAVQILKPSFPPPLCRACLERCFPVKEWRPPDDSLMEDWVQEARKRKNKPALKSIKPEQTRILSSFLFQALTDPDNVIDNTEKCLFRLWESAFEENLCFHCTTPVLCGTASHVFLKKIDQLIEGDQSMEFTEDELTTAVYFLSDSPEEAEELLKENPPEWPNNYLRACDAVQLKDLKTKLQSFTE